MNTWSGCALWKAKPAGNHAEQTTTSSGGIFFNLGNNANNWQTEYHLINERNTPNLLQPMTIGIIANPSNPSVRLTAFDAH